MKRTLMQVAGLSMLIGSLSGPATAQSLNWDGQTGGVVTPFAGVIKSPGSGVGLPAVSFHLLNGGEVVGTHFQTSFTGGLANRVEVGYTRSSVASGEGEGASTLFNRGFNTTHAKVTMVEESASPSGAPAISAGVAVRRQQEHVEGGLGVATQNADIYGVLTKTFAVTDTVAILANGGLKMTNASMMGLAGNSPDWTAAGFVAGGIVLREMVTVGSDFCEQPWESRE